MSRRTKNKGGRMTPKGTRPSKVGFAPSAVDAMPPGLDDLLPRLDDDSAAFRDAEASAFVSIFEVATKPTNVIDLRREDHPSVAASQMLDMLGGLGPHPPQIVVDTVAAFATYGGSTAEQARAALRSFRTRPSARAATLGQGDIVSTTLVEDIFGESTQYMFDLRYPGGDGGAVAVLIDRLNGGILKDTIVMPSVAAFTDLLPEAEGVVYTSVTAGRAAAAIDEAYWMNDHTVGVEAFIDEDVVGMRRMVERLLSSVEREPVIEADPLANQERAALVHEFVEWARAHDPLIQADVLDWASVAVDFACDRGTGNPLTWGAGSIIAFLEWSSQALIAEPDALRRLPDLLCLFVPWAHARVGWGDHHVDDALGVIDVVLPLFEEAITASAADDDLDFDLGLGSDPDTIRTEAPAGGTHPEPFDATGLGRSAERADEIAILASVSARATFDDEYVTLVRRLTADAARHDPRLFAKGRADIWAAGVIYAVAQLTNVVGGWGPMAMYADELTARLAGAPSTIVAKAAAIRRAVGESNCSTNPRYQHSRSRFDHSQFRLPGLGAALGPGDLFDGDDDGLGYEPSAPMVAYERLPDGSSFELRCELVGLKLWRTFRVPTSATLLDLHMTLQRAFDWEDCHLHRFTVGGHAYTTASGHGWGGLPDDLEGADVRLDELLRPGAVIDYVYDFGDNWEVLIRVQAVLGPDPARPRVELIDGAGGSPPEDCGGVWGYLNLVEVLEDSSHPDYDDLREWAGDFRPDSFDLEAVAARLRLV